VGSFAAAFALHSQAFRKRTSQARRARKALIASGAGAAIKDAKRQMKFPRKAVGRAYLRRPLAWPPKSSARMAAHRAPGRSGVAGRAKRKAAGARNARRAYSR